MRQQSIYLSLSVVGVLLLCQTAPLVAAAPPQTSIISGDKRIRVERFVPKGKGTFPAVVLLHGIDGMEASGSVYRSLARTLAEKGYVAVLVHYFDRTATKKQDLPQLLKQFRAYLDDSKTRDKESLALEATFTAWMDTVKVALADTRKHPRVDPERVGLVGISLGAFLATSTAVESSQKVRCVVDLFGGLPRVLANRVGQMPPALIIHGDRDEVVPVRHAETLRDQLKEHRRVFEYKVYSGVGHCFIDSKGNLAWFPAFDAQQRALTFLSRHLAQPRRERPAVAAIAEIGPVPQR